LISVIGVQIMIKIYLTIG